VARVIAGEAGGRRLAVPAGRDTRPTSDRAREGLFATVTSMVGPLDGARVLDLYAGSGAVGLEALSRGAGHVLLVESGARAARVIRENIKAIGLPGAEVITDRVERVLARGPGPVGGRYDVVFADPPYALPDREVTAMLSLLAGGDERTGLAAGGGAAGLAAGGGAAGLAARGGAAGLAARGGAAGLAARGGAVGLAARGGAAGLAARGGGPTAAREGIADRAWLGPRALVIVERATRSGPVRWPEGYVPDRARRYGEATFWYGLRAGTVRPEPP
jgi:16S rRNA (guanine966-N2)-methyltransferase